MGVFWLVVGIAVGLVLGVGVTLVVAGLVFRPKPWF